MFEKSVLVVAHPDDEALFFSSIISKVDKIFFVFLNCPSRPQWSEGRRRSLNEYPLPNITCIGLDESETFHDTDWKKPKPTRFGMNTNKKSERNENYEKNYKLLKEYFSRNLKEYKNVFSHNPWGEYGHCEHVQIYRVLSDIRQEYQFNLWYSNYCSNKSFDFMIKYISGFENKYTTFQTNNILSEKLKNIYNKNNCWTWYKDWKGFHEECYILDSNIDGDMDYGHIFPLNMIKLEKKYVTEKKTGSLNLISSKTKKLYQKMYINKTKSWK